MNTDPDTHLAESNQTAIARQRIQAIRDHVPDAVDCPGPDRCPMCEAQRLVRALEAEGVADDVVLKSFAPFATTPPARRPKRKRMEGRRRAARKRARQRAKASRRRNRR